MPSSPSPPGSSTTSSPALLLDRVAARYETDPSQVQQALRGFDELLARRAARRRAATGELVAELYARDGVDPAPGRVDAEAEAACAQERDERLAAELRRLVTPQVAAVHRARTLTERELDRECQAALNLLGAAPRSVAEFGPQAERRHAAERAVVDRFAAGEAEAVALLEEAHGWRPWRRRALGRELTEARRGRQAAEHRARLAAVRLAAVQLREAQRAEWLARPEVGEVLGAGAAALRELHDRAQASDVAATVELPAVDRPVSRGAAR